LYVGRRANSCKQAKPLKGLHGWREAPSFDALDELRSEMNRLFRKIVTSVLAVACASAHLPAARAQQSVTAAKFAVTSGHPDATAAGMAILRGGGNVIDAAVATSLCLGVAEPYGSGIGGKGMLLYRDGKTGRIYALEAMCEASESLDAAEFADRPRRERYYGYTSVAVPGLVAALEAAHLRWGFKKWRDVVTPAADLAENGVTVSEKMFQMMRPKRNLLRRDKEAARLYLVNNETPAVGAAMKNADLAKSLRLIAEQGSKVFYEGEIARAIVAAAESAGAPLTLNDFRTYKPRWGEPLFVDYDDHRVYTCPPPLTGGATVLASLRALDGVAALDATSGRDAKYIDLVGRVLLSVYPRVDRTIADVPTATADASKLFADDSVRAIQAEAAEVDPARADEPAKTSRLEATADDYAEASTTHLIVADSEGNIACLTQSLSYHFGACVIAPGTGFILNDSMSNFSTGRPTACNYVAPGKRERSTIAPIIVVKDDKPVLALGIPGGQRIPTTTLQLLTDFLHFGTPLDKAFDRSRFHVRRPLTSAEAANIVDLEDDAPPAFDEQLTEMGWKPERHKRNGAYFGGGSAVMYHEDGKMRAVADLRRTNSADGN
jgi:gamma-glutamyltranspeptidase / glutathione hydrolase